MRKILYITLSLLTALLCGCTQEEDITQSAQPLPSVTVTVGGFSSGNGVETRISDMEYTTTFTKGDKIGISAVADDGVILDDNVPYTYDGSKWTPADATNTIHNYNYAGVTYFAYYPYSDTMNGTKSEQEVIGKFTPAVDQSTYAKYTASDLMTGAGTITDANTGSPKMALALKHKMCLIVVEVKSKSYVTTDGYVYTEPIVFNSIKLAGQELYSSQFVYHASTGVYKYLTAPGLDSWSVDVSYDAGNPAINYKYSTIVTPSTAGKYYLIKMHNGSPTQRNLQVGDFYYQDGAILPKDATFYQFAANPCIGVVFKAGVGANDNINYYDGKLSAIHGYAVALNEGKRKWGDASKRWTLTSWYDYYGCRLTKMLLAATAPGISFPACDYCVNYTPAPTGISSGWYFPACLEMSDYVVANNSVLNVALNKITTGKTLISTTDYYISSSEANSSQDRVLARKSTTTGNPLGLLKSDEYLVRPVLAF